MAKRRSSAAGGARAALRPRAAVLVPQPTRFGVGTGLLLFAAWFGVLLVVYAPALDGPFVSDDLHYVAANPYVHGVSADNLVTIANPWGPATIAVVNYSPVQLWLHALTWELVGERTFGHHLLNLAFHAGASVLLVPLLWGVGLPFAAALLASLMFLLHPANVEAVAWISQLKTSASLVLALGALLLHPRRPALGALLFALSLLTKAQAAVVLPVAFWMEWVRTGRLRLPWPVVWLVIFLAFAGVEFAAHQRAGAAEATLHQDPDVLLRTMASLFARYAAMAASGLGTSAFQEPDPARSWLDPRWLASLPLLAFVGWRLLVSLRDRRVEGAFWIFAGVSFAPVSQIFPFLYPFADRYLYYMLPGFLGGALLAGQQGLSQLPPARRTALARTFVALGLVLCASFAVRANERARIWRSPAFILADAARHYPDGVSARLTRARNAARAGDAETAAREIRGALARGYNRFEQLQGDPSFDPVRDSGAFRAVLREMAGTWIEAGRRWRDPTQGELRKLASAHAVRGERDAAVSLLRRALARGGPFDAAIRDDLARLGARP